MACGHVRGRGGEGTGTPTHTSMRGRIIQHPRAYRGEAGAAGVGFGRVDVHGLPSAVEVAAHHDRLCALQVLDVRRKCCRSRHCAGGEVSLSILYCQQAGAWPTPLGPGPPVGPLLLSPPPPPPFPLFAQSLVGLRGEGTQKQGSRRIHGSAHAPNTQPAGPAPSTHPRPTHSRGTPSASGHPHCSESGAGARFGAGSGDAAAATGVLVGLRRTSPGEGCAPSSATPPPPLPTPTHPPTPSAPVWNVHRDEVETWELGAHDAPLAVVLNPPNAVGGGLGLDPAEWRRRAGP